MSTKKQLEIILQKLKASEKPKNYLEQYPTDASTAANILMKAYSDGNVLGKNILDLGTGNGIFAIGAKILGADKVLGIDSDPDQIAVAKENGMGIEIDFQIMNVSDVKGQFDTVFMNPPFGSVKAHADLPFIKKAAECGTYLYAIHNLKSRDFVRDQYSSLGAILREEEISIIVPRLYAHHRKDRVKIPSVLFVVRFSHNYDHLSRNPTGFSRGRISESGAGVRFL